MKIDYDGRLWDFDLAEMDVAQCEGVEKWVGKGLGEWSNQLGAGSIKSLIALWWVMRAQNGDSPGPMDPGPGFKPVKLLVALNTAIEAEQAAEAEVQAAEAEPDPTTGGSPEPAGTPVSLPG